MYIVLVDVDVSAAVENTAVANFLAGVRNYLIDKIALWLKKYCTVVQVRQLFSALNRVKIFKSIFW